MKFYDASKPLYLGTDTSSIGLGADHLQVMDGMNCGQDDVPDNTALCSTAFASKRLSSMERQYSSIEQEVLDILHGLEKFAKQFHIITDHGVLPPVECSHTIQAWSRPIYSGLAVPLQLHRK